MKTKTNEIKSEGEETKNELDALQIGQTIVNFKNTIQEHFYVTLLIHDDGFTVANVESVRHKIYAEKLSDDSDELPTKNPLVN